MPEIKHYKNFSWQAKPLIHLTLNQLMGTWSVRFTIRTLWTTAVADWRLCQLYHGMALYRYIVICENDVCKAGTKTILELLSAGTQVAELECLQMKKTAFSSMALISNLHSPCSPIKNLKSFFDSLFMVYPFWAPNYPWAMGMVIASMVYVYPENTDPTDYGMGPPEGFIRPWTTESCFQATDRSLSWRM